MRNLSDLAPEERAALLLRKYREVFDAFRPYAECRLYALLDDGVTLVSTAVLRDGAAEAERWAMMIGQGLSGLAAITGVPNLYHDAHDNPRTYYANPAQYLPLGEQAMVAPLRRGDAMPVAVLFLNRLGRVWWSARQYAAFLTLAGEMRDDWFR